MERWDWASGGGYLAVMSIFLRFLRRARQKKTIPAKSRASPIPSPAPRPALLLLLSPPLLEPLFDSDAKLGSALEVEVD